MPIIYADRLTVRQAAAKAGKTRETIVSWARKYAIGWRLDDQAPWVIDPLGLAIVIDGNKDALAAYQQGARSGPLINPYLSA